jgi:hypothetical protein
MYNEGHHVFCFVKENCCLLLEIGGKLVNFDLEEIEGKLVHFDLEQIGEKLMHLDFEPHYSW